MRAWKNASLRLKFWLSNLAKQWNALSDLRADVDRKFMWLIGIQIGTLLTVIGILFARAAGLF